MVRNNQGWQLQFILKDEVTGEEVLMTSASEDCNLNSSETIMDLELNELDISGRDSLYRSIMISDAVESLGVDEIMQQFMQGIEDYPTFNS